MPRFAREASSSNSRTLTDLSQVQAIRFSHANRRLLKLPALGLGGAPGTLLVLVFLLAPLFLPGRALAGLNSRAVAHLYWQVGNGTGQTDRNSTAGIPQFVITVKGLKSFRGADVQLFLTGQNGLPQAWQCQSGGCAEAAVTLKRGGFGGVNYPNAFTSAPAVPSVLESQNQMYYDSNAQPCLTPPGYGTVWMSAAGVSGAGRDSTKEYALFAMKIDETGTATDGCSGDMSDTLGVQPVVIQPNFHVPCDGTTPGCYVALLDANDDVDYAPFGNGCDSLTWQAGQQSFSAPIVQMVYPSSLVPGVETQLTLQGANLGQTGAVSLITETGEAIQASTVVPNGPTSVQATISLPEGAAGAFDVVATGPAGSATLAGGANAAAQNQTACWRSGTTQTFHIPSELSHTGIHSGGSVTEPSIAVGPTNVVVAGPGEVRIFSKTDSTNFRARCLNDFFNLASCCPGGYINPIYGDSGNTNDPQCLYDRIGRRYLVLCFSNTKVGGTPISHLHLAVSQSDDAFGSWYIYHLPAQPPFPDRPRLGITSDKIVICAVTNGETSFLRALDRDSVYSHTVIPAASNPDSVNFYDYSIGTNIPVTPTRNLSPIPDIEICWTSAPYLFWQRITGPAFSLTKHLVKQVPLTSVPWTESRTAPQKSVTTTDSLYDCSVSSPDGLCTANWLNLSDIYLRRGAFGTENFTVAWHQAYSFPCGDPGDVIRDVIRVVRVSVTPNFTGGFIAVDLDTIVGDPSFWFTFPAVCADSIGNIYLGFNGTGPNIFPSCFVTCKPVYSAIFEPTQVGAIGWAKWHGHRWGDFTSISLDETGIGAPVAYYVGQFAIGASTNGNACLPPSMAHGKDTLATQIVPFYMTPAPAAVEGTVGGHRPPLRVSPNPLRGEAVVRYEGRAGEHLRLDILDVSGRQVRAFRDIPGEPGSHALKWNCRTEQGVRVAAGIYYCLLRGRKTLATEKLVLFR